MDSDFGILTENLRFDSLLAVSDSLVPVTFEPDYRFWNMSDFRSEQAWNPLGECPADYSPS